MCSFRANFVLPFTCYEMPKNRPKLPKMSHLKYTIIKIMSYLVNTHKFQLSLFRIPLLTITERKCLPAFPFFKKWTFAIFLFFRILLYMSFLYSKIHKFASFHCLKFAHVRKNAYLCVLFLLTIPFPHPMCVHVIGIKE